MPQHQPSPLDHAESALPRRPGNALKVHDNSAVARALAGVSNLSELLALAPKADDIMVGVVHLKTAGHTATRPLSRRVLFMVLKRCPSITTASTDEAVRHKGYSRQQVERYAAAARVASKALAPLLATIADLPSMTMAEEQRLIDEPYKEGLSRALAADANRAVSIPHLKEDHDDNAPHARPYCPEAMTLQFDLYSLSHDQFLT